jgi:hypothetical protein
MNQTAIFGPFFAMILLTMAVWIYMYARRIAFLNGGNIDPQELTKPGRLAELSPPAVNNPSDNFKNLFEMPVLFYALAIYLFAVHEVDGVYLAAAWVFVAFRIAHSAVHCTFNRVMVRFYLYAIASLALWFVAIRAAIVHLAG